MRAVPWIVAAAAVAVLGYFYGYFRAAVAVALFAAILVIGVRYLANLVNAPPEPEIADVSSYGLKYVCTVCGLELRVEKAAKDSAPRHCGEAMDLVREDGKPPLHPV